MPGWTMSDKAYLTAILSAQIDKHLLAWKKKQDVDDLKRARWYIDRMVKIIEEEQHEQP